MGAEPGAEPTSGRSAARKSKKKRRRFGWVFFLVFVADCSGGVLVALEPGMGRIGSRG